MTNIVDAVDLAAFERRFTINESPLQTVVTYAGIRWPVDITFGCEGTPESYDFKTDDAEWADCDGVASWFTFIADAVEDWERDRSLGLLVFSELIEPAPGRCIPRNIAHAFYVLLESDLQDAAYEVGRAA